MNNPLLSWLKQIGSSSDDRASSLATDQFGNVFISGYTAGELEAGQSPGISDAFLAKYDSAGGQVWLKQMGSSSADRASSVATDQFGNVFISGSTAGELEAGQSQGSVDAFLAKYDSAGDQVWLKQMGSSSSDYAFAIATDQFGNVFISGFTAGELEAGQSQGSGDAFLAKYDSAGGQVWLKQIGSSSFDYASAVATDQFGNVFISGSTAGELEAGQSQGDEDAFLAKYDSAGGQVWLKQIGSSSADRASSVATDQFGNVFISGSTWGELEAGQSQGDEDAFLAKYDSAGGQVWLKQIAGGQVWLKQMASVDRASSVATDQFGNVFISGSTWGELEAGQSQGSGDAFLAKYDSAGDQVWLKQMGSSSSDYAFAIATDQFGNVFISGSTIGELEAGQSQGRSDAFLAKYVDDLSMTQHHLLIESKIDQLSEDMAELKHAQLPLELDLSLIQFANDQTKGRGESRISESEAVEIITQAQDSELNISETRKKTLAYIYAKYSLTRGAKEQILKALS